MPWSGEAIVCDSGQEMDKIGMCSVLVHSCFRNVGLHIYEWATFWIKFGLLRYLIVFQMLFLLLQNIREQTVT